MCIRDRMDGKDLLYIEEYLDVFSETGEIKGFIRGRGGDNEVKVKDNIDFDPKSKNNSIVIEERKINLNTGDEAYIQFVSTADMNSCLLYTSIKWREPGKRKASNACTKSSCTRCV